MFELLPPFEVVFVVFETLEVLLFDDEDVVLLLPPLVVVFVVVVFPLSPLFSSDGEVLACAV